MNVFVVINPNAGGGRAGRDWPALAARLRDRLGAFDHARTDHVGHATELVRDAVRNGARLVIAVGGDGTVNEAVNGLAGEDGLPRDGSALAAVTVGTGSDLARSLRNGATLDEKIERIASEASRRIDLGRASFTGDDGGPMSRLFVNIGSFGISGPIDRAVNAVPRDSIVPRKLLYLTATVRALLAFRFQQVAIRIDDRPAVETRIAVVALANGAYFGGGMMIAPDAVLDDGLFDVVTLRGTSKLVLLRDLRLVYGGRHRNHPAIAIERGQRVTVEPLGGEPVLIDLDGESPGRLPASFEILPGALEVRG